MRLSSNEGDPGYEKWRGLFGGNDIRIFLDDVEQTMCTVADEEDGHIMRCVTDDDGKVLLVGEYIQYERVEGNVRIEITPRS